MTIKYRKILFPFLACSLAIVASPKTDANLSGSYKPLKKSASVDQRRTVSSGSRSYCQASVEPNSLKLLVPSLPIAHQTTTSHPRLYFYSDVVRPVKVRFALINLSNRNQVIYERRIIINSQGIKSISLPKSVELQEKTAYTWNIGIPCKNNQKLEQEVLSAGIKYNEAFTEMLKQIEQATSVTDKIHIYAKNRAWYQAIDLALENQSELGYDNHLHAFDSLFNLQAAELENQFSEEI